MSNLNQSFNDFENQENKKPIMDLVGKFFMVGFEGTDVTEEISLLITKYHVSTIILSGRNFINASQAKILIRDLQQLAMQSNYEYPIIFVIDEEGGMLNSLFDKHYITQFPGAMSLNATGSTSLVYQVHRAIAKELKSIGFSMCLGPVLDILKNTSNTLMQQMIGVRSPGYDLESVLRYGKAAAKAFKDEKIFNCGKHFPGYGSATVNSNFELPMIFENIEQLLDFNLVPYIELINEDLLDSILVGGCAVPGVNTNDLHACLSPTIVTSILREKLKFNGIVISECLLLEALDRNYGVVQGCISAFSVGCDLIMLCSNFEIQQQAILGLKAVIEDQIIDYTIVNKAASRIKKLSQSLPSWQEVIELSFLPQDILNHHKLLSKNVYNRSITVIRDAGLPITKYLKPNVENENTILLLTPLISPLYETVDVHGNKSHINNTKVKDIAKLKLHYGEDVFVGLGNLLSKYKPGYKICHTSYNSNGLTSFHEELILKSKVILFFCAETTNNLYQVGVSKHVSMLCNSNSNKFKKNVYNNNRNRQLIIVSVSSPTDFLYDINIGGSPTGYICTYDYTMNALSKLPKVLFGDFEPTGVVPGLIKSANETKKVMDNLSGQRTHSWLVEVFEYKRDWENLVNLLKNNNYIDFSAGDLSLTCLKRFFVDIKNHKSFVVRNTSSKTILGISVTWIYNNSLVSTSENNYETIGNLMCLLVDKNKRNISIGNHLYKKTIKYFFEDKRCGKVYLGRDFPKISIFNDPSLNLLHENSDTLRFFKKRGWNLNNGAFSTDDSPLLKKKKINHSEFMNSKEINVTAETDSNKTYLINENLSSADFKTNNSLDNHNLSESNNSIENQIYKISKLLNRPIQHQQKYLMKLNDIHDWKVAENLVRQLQVVGIMFDICKDLTEIFSTQNPNRKAHTLGIKTSDTVQLYDDSNQLCEFSNNNYEIYFELFKEFFSSTKDSYLDSLDGLDIIVALEPTKRSVVGSLVVLNERSQFLKFYPFLHSLKEKQPENHIKENQEFVLITGHFIDPLYSTLSEVFKLGLICTALMYVKTQYRNCSECYIMDIDEKQLRSLQDNGFTVVEKYYNYYSVKCNEQ
jgi:beta-N-acetylhexosaminidase